MKAPLAHVCRSKLGKSLAKFGADPAENEPMFADFRKKAAKFAKIYP